MFASTPVRPLWRAAAVLFATLLFACSDASGPAPRPMPTTPNAQLAPALIVTNTDDDGSGSLRNTILSASDGDVIQFDPAIAGQTIALTSGVLSIGKIVTIEGPVATGMTISGSFSSGVFSIPGGPAVLRNLSIVNGRSTSLGGGGIFVSGSAVLDHVLVANNEAEEGGGGIYTLDNSQLTILNSTVTGNTADNGGGMTTQGLVTIRNSTISKNTVVGGGGGIFAVSGTLVLRNSIVANNVSGFPTQTNCAIKSGVSFIASGMNLSNDDTCGTDAIGIADPRLGPLADNGGPTHTQALLFGSPAIDGGTSCTEVTDQRYITRPQGSTCDVGAFEFDTFRNISLTMSSNVAVNAKTGVATVTGTISCPGFAYSPLSVTLSQTQKTTGRFTTIIQAQANIPAATCTSTPSSWSVALTPATGKFAPGAATGSASLTSAPSGYVPASVTSPLKLFQVK